MKKGRNQTYEVEIVNLLKRLTLDVIGEIAFGVEFNSLGQEKTFGGFKFSDLADKALNGINARFLTPKLVWDLPLPVFNKEKEAVTILKVLLLLNLRHNIDIDFSSIQGMFEGILQQTQEKMNNGEETFNLVSILLDAHNTPEGKLVYPHDQMLGECFSIWGAGHDTTTYTLAHTIKLLSKNQAAQDEIRKEFMELRDRLNGGQPNYNDFQGCRYALACLKESQRLFPIAPMLLRTPVKDMVINNQFFKKDTSVFINVLCIQRSEEYYKNAEKYLPERWLNESEEGDEHFDQFHFLTFGAGQRSCFGKKLAILEIVATLYYLLTNFKVEDDSAKHPHLFENKFGMVPVDKKMIITLTKMQK